MLKLYLFILTFSVFSNTVSALHKYEVTDSTENSLLKIKSISKDSDEYELVVFDVRYESFLLLQPPMNFYSESYYKTWNNLYVNEWNYRFHSNINSELYETFIDYNSHTEYGIELEYRLYYFFRYFETANQITLVQRGK